MALPEDSAEAQALRALARLLAPYVVEELRSQSFELPAEREPPGSFDDETAEVYVEGLRRDVIERAIEFFGALARPPHLIDSETLASQLGVSGRGLSGALLTPLKRRGRKLGLDDPWKEAESGRGRKVWTDRAGTAAVVLEALERASQANRKLDVLAAATSNTGELQRPVPIDVYVWQPENTEGLKTGPGGSSCLRDSRPGSRAVIYQASEHQGIVALFDVGKHPREHRKWRWFTDGYIHVLPEPVSRDELLADESLRDVFLHIQGRRRLPPRAQRALHQMLETRCPGGVLPPFEPLSRD